jgi:hypothetical protein
MTLKVRITSKTGIGVDTVVSIVDPDTMQETKMPNVRSVQINKIEPQSVITATIEVYVNEMDVFAACVSND